ncbi:MAG: hypothetical protein IIB00_00060 [candidate division Zixibacteria bacterium]|nr:hypothetical protein [candidate division Zixibacteria bacterium]
MRKVNSKAPTVVVLIMCQCLCAEVSAFQLSGGRSRGMGGAISLSSATASDYLRAPGIALGDGQWYLEAGAERRFELKELDAGYLAWAFRRNRAGFSFGVQQFGRSKGFAEKTARGAVAYYVNKFSLALIGSFRSYDFGASYSSLNAVSLGLSAGLTTRHALVSIVVDNLNRPSFVSSAPEEEIEGSLYAEARGAKLRTSARITLRENKKPVLGLGQIVPVGKAADLFWGVSSHPLIYGGGLEIRQSKYGIIYSGSYHPTLGYSQNISIVYYSGAPGN